MKSICRIVLLGAGIILSLAGCQKGNTPGELTEKAVRFSATSGSINTRTSFTGDGTGTTINGKTVDEFGRKYLSHERIKWTEEVDQIMIASDYATVFEGETKYATYLVTSVTEDGDKSYAKLYEKAATEELYFNKEHTSYKFWGIYPSTAGVGTSLENAQASYAIETAQAPFGDPVVTPHTIDGKSVTLTTLSPDMTKAVMLAAAENQTAESVELDFYPGFTAFEFTLCAAESDLGIQSIVLSDASGHSIAGNVAAAIKPGLPQPLQGAGTEFTCTASATKVTYTFPANTVIGTDKYLTFTVFALPQLINGLHIEFHMSDGTIQTAKLQNKSDHSPIQFAGCTKHCLRGIAIPGGWKWLYLDINVMDWILAWEGTSEQSNGSGVQATQFTVNGASNLRTLKDSLTPEEEEPDAANKDYRQCWVFDPGQTVTVKYKIMMPEAKKFPDGIWGIEKFGDTSDFNVTVTSSAEDVNALGNQYYGPLGEGATYLTIEITSSATKLKKLYFKTSVSNGESIFSLDSETQLYDMRGYHYFIVNGSESTEFDDLNL